MGAPVEPLVVSSSADQPGVPGGRSRGFDTLLTAIAQVAVLLGAAVMGVLIARRFGSTAKTDGFFAANAIYGVSLFVAQSLRTTTAAPLVDGGPGFQRFNQHLAAIVWIFGVSVILACGAALLANSLGLAADARSVFQTAILVLCPAAGLQLFAGQASAMLATLGDYATASAAYMIGSAVAVVGFVALTGPLGVSGVAAALAGGSFASAGVTGAALVRRGWRPQVPVLDRGSRTIARRIGLGAIALVAAQLVLTTSVAFAGATGAGNATLYSYAMMSIMVLTAALASPISIVFAPVIAREWDGRPSSLVATTMTGYRAGALLLGPAVAALVLLGPAIGRKLLSGIDGASVNRIFDIALVISPALLGTMLAMVPLVAVFAQGRFRELAIWSTVVTAAHAVASAAVVLAGGGLMAVAAVATLSSLALSGVPIALAFGRETPALLRAAAVAVADFVAPAAVVFTVAAAIIDFDRTALRGAVTFVLAGVAYGAWIVLRHRTETVALITALRPMGR